MAEIIIVGGGISGLTLALSLHEVGIACRIYEGAPEFQRLGVGLNLHPHGVRELSKLGLEPALAKVGVETKEMNYYSRHGEFIFSEPRGRYAGYSWPQFSIHRGDFHRVLADAVRERLGAEALVMNHRCVGFTQDADGVTVHFANAQAATSCRTCAARWRSAARVSILRSAPSFSRTRGRRSITASTCGAGCRAGSRS